jgi:hypothetical protein
MAFVHLCSNRRPSSPGRERQRSECDAFALWVENDPTFIALLDVSKLQFSHFGPSEAASNQNRDDRMISFAAHRVGIRRGHQQLHLIGTKPIAQPHADSFCTFDPPNAGCQLRTEQSRVGRFVRKSPNGHKPQVNGRNDNRRASS